MAALWNWVLFFLVCVGAFERMSLPEWKSSIGPIISKRAHGQSWAEVMQNYSQAYRDVKWNRLDIGEIRQHTLNSTEDILYFWIDLKRDEKRRLDIVLESCIGDVDLYVVKQTVPQNVRPFFFFLNLHSISLKAILFLLKRRKLPGKQHFTWSSSQHRGNIDSISVFEASGLFEIAVTAREPSKFAIFATYDDGFSFLPIF